jgi:phosphomannomutase
MSIDGDSDRPLVLGVEPEGANCRVKFYGGDLVGMVVADYLKADAVVVPVSCNDALDRGPLQVIVEPKTRIGSPYVIAGMQQAVAAGRKAVCGWEANGGFLLGSTLTRDGRTLRELPTRDAFLPILGVLFCAAEKGKSVCALFDELPRRFSRAALLKNFPRLVSDKIVRRFSPAECGVREIVFARTTDPGQLKIRADIGKFFSPALGFGTAEKVDVTDGVRIYFSNGDVAHVRPSGNADELRIYAVADTQMRADAIAQAGVTEPNGILRRLEAAVSS